MTDRESSVRRDAPRRAYIAALLGTVSALAIMAVGHPVQARSVRTPGTSSPTAAAVAAQQAASAQAAAAAKQAQISLERAAAALRAMQQAQQAARAAAQQAASNVPNGLVTGGLMPAGGTTETPFAGIDNDPTLWVGAQKPVQSTTTGGQTKVDITQTQQKAILNWETFNVGRDTELNFLQGGSDWTVLNRVMETSTAPSQILGRVNALGGVYVINRNGIIFGAGAQVNVHALIASDLDVGGFGLSRKDRDAFFLGTGIGNGSNAITFSNTFDLTKGPPTTPGGIIFEAGDLVGGGVTVQAGAKISASFLNPDTPGFIYLFGANVSNAGTLKAAAGQVSMVAAQQITLKPGSYTATAIPPELVEAGFRGTGFQIKQYAARYALINDILTPIATPTNPGYRPGTGLVVNNGLIETPRGIVVMNGDRVNVGAAGVISADTGISRNSIVLLDAATSVNLDGTISILPASDGADNNDTNPNFAPAFVSMGAATTVTLGSTGLISAPSASVLLDAHNDQTRLGVQSNAPGPQRVVLAAGATIDVSGLQNVELPVSANFIDIEIRGPEVADMPLQRSGALFGKTLTIDIRQSGTRSDGTTWVGTPLADSSGYIANVGRSIEQRMTSGGTVTMRTALTPGSEVVLEQGSVVNMAGGSIRYTAGMVPTTYLVGIDGRIYSMDKADPNLIYVGIAGQFTANHARWGVTESWSSLSQRFEPGYVEGRDAGGLSITTVRPVLGGKLMFGSDPGQRQIGAGLAPSVTETVIHAGTPNEVRIPKPTPTQARGDEMPSQGFLSITTPTSVVIGASGDHSSNFTPRSPQTLLSADQLSGYALSALIIRASDLVLAAGRTVNLAAGGSFSATAAGAIDIAGTVSAAGGRINLETDRLTLNNSFNNLFRPPVSPSGELMRADIFVGGVLDVSGRWVNDTGRFGADALGPGFINGGSISLTTKRGSGPTGERGLDVTGNILLSSGSLLDVSSGGYISPQGKPKLADSGLMAGSAGSISLALYQGPIFTDPVSGVGGTPRFPESGSTLAGIELGGTLRAYGFERNGTLSLAAPKAIRIGEQPLAPGEGLYIPTSLLTNGGFGHYVIESARDTYEGSGNNTSITVSAGTSLTLQQRNLSSIVDYRAIPTGTKISTVAPVVVLPDEQRPAVDLTLRSDNILLDAGSRIVTDPQAHITLAGSVNTEGTGAARDRRADNVLLLGTIVNHGGSVSVNAQKTWLGPDALIDLSGTFVANSRFGLPNGPSVSGTLLAGGTFTVEGAVPNSAPTANPDVAGSYVVAEDGAVVDVSGATASIQVRTRRVTSSVASWSDAGTVSVNAAAFVWGGMFRADADARANRGTIILGGGPVALTQNSNQVISALANISTPTTPTGLPDSPSSPGLGALNNKVIAAVDRLNAFDNVFLYSGVSAGGAARIFTSLPGNTYGVRSPVLTELVIVPDSSGTFTWDVTNRLHIAASAITASTANSDVSFNAPYVSFTGGSGNVAAGSSTLRVDAKTIDIEGAAFSGFQRVELKSAGDIRLSTPKVANDIDPTSGVPVDPTTFTGRLAVVGDLLLEAQRIYPVSAVDFTIQSAGTVTFQAPAGSRTDIPLSAGGSITVLAPIIQQNGNLFAPLGRITLGGSGTQRVTLGEGSLTSLSLGEMVIPYGETTDGVNWFYNASLEPLEQPPSKGIVLNGQQVTVSEGSTVDLRGGGDLQAMEWVPGKGGSRDTLTTTPKGETVYALLPSNSDAVAAFDIHFTTDRATRDGDAYPLAGTQIQIDGGNGIPAGTYVLLPAHYATLPGALRVVDKGSNLGVNVASGTKLSDGTVLVTGHYVQSTAPGKQSSGENLFAIQTEATWRQYSEYSFNKANSYFAEQAIRDGRVVPRLPIDAGRLAVIAQQSILLAGTALTQPAEGGRGGELDISATKLAVVSEDQRSAYESQGFVALPASQLNGFGFESILIGGLRSDQVDGTLITPSATNVVVDTAGGPAFTAPEILLVAQSTSELKFITQEVSVPGGPSATVVLPTLVPVAGTGTVTIKSGSVIETTGSVSSGFGRNYFFAKPTDVTAQIVADLLGGKVSADGRTITGADPLNLPLIVNGNTLRITDLEGRPLEVPLSAIDLNNPVHVTALINALLNSKAVAAIAYSYGVDNKPGLGAMFVATSDAKLSVSGPSAVAPPLKIEFAFGNPPQPVTGTITLPGRDTGSVAVEAGARISTQILSMQATARSNGIVIDPNAILQVKQVNLTANGIGIAGEGASPTAPHGLLLSSANLGPLAGVQGLALKALGSSGITFYGNVDFNPGSTMQSLAMDASAITGTGGNATISIGGTISLGNIGAAAAPASGGVNGTLTLNAKEIDLFGGTQTIAGFRQVNWNASERVFVGGSGALTLGSGADQVDLSVTTPNILVGSQSASGNGSQFVLSTQGHVAIARPDGAPIEPVASSEIGGNLAITAGSIFNTGTIQAQAGTLTLRATTGDVTLGEGAFIAAGGYKKTLIDVETHVAGGKVVLQADKGNLVTAPSSVIDVAQPTGGLGYGGDVEMTAPLGSATLLGAIRAAGGPGLGGRFKLDVKTAPSLDSLADTLLAGGVSGAIDIRTREGNLVLSQGHTLKANVVSLTADVTPATANDTTRQHGEITIAGIIDASGHNGKTADGTGQAGGQVSLYAANAVTLASTGRIKATTSHTDERGGDVTIGIGVNAKGGITLENGSLIDVSGGTKGGLSGGTLALRAPLIAGNDANNNQADVNVAIGDTADIVGARSVTLEAYVTFSTDGSNGRILNGRDLGWDGIIDPAGTSTGHDAMRPISFYTDFYTKTLVEFVQGNWENYKFDNIIADKLLPLAKRLDPSGNKGIVHLRPGVELVNPNGDITVASNWNLAAVTGGTAEDPVHGDAYNLQNGKYVHVHETTDEQNASYVKFDYRLTSPLGVDPGALTLRAAGNININASISDGFFQFRNHLQTVVSGTPQELDGKLHQINAPNTRVNAPYNKDANGFSPSAEALAAADLFPNKLRVLCEKCSDDPNLSDIVTVTNPGSWSYRFTAGADVTAGPNSTMSSNPNAMQPLATVAKGNVIVDGYNKYEQWDVSRTAKVSVYLPTMVRTGTGNISVAAARDATFNNPVAPGVIYAAGVNTERLVDPGYTESGGTLVANNPDGFFEPQLLGYGSGAVAARMLTDGLVGVFGPPTEAAFPHQGGDVTIVAQRDIVGNGNPIWSGVVSTALPAYQYYQPWLMSQTEITPITTRAQAASVSLLGAGVFAPTGNKAASQTAWWIQYGSFQQGILSAGGNVTVTAGRDLIDVSVSLPTTGRVSGGLAPGSSGVTSVPVTHLYDGGNMTIRAGRDLRGGSYYEGSGHASIMVRGSIGQSGTLTTRQDPLPNVPLLAVDTGQITMVAGGTISMAGVVNPAELHRQRSSVADPSFTTVLSSPPPLFMDTYGPNSAVRLLAITGDIDIRYSPTLPIYNDGISGVTGAASIYPASFEAIALGGDITTNLMRGAGSSRRASDITLSGSKHGTFQLLAQGSVDLTGGYTPADTAVTPVRARPAFSAGPALLDEAFDPFRPNNGFGAASSKPVLAHQDDAAVARIYAVTGDITGVGGLSTDPQTQQPDQQRIEINRPAVIRAGRDIVDLNLIVQNIEADDVSSVEAGRDIYYTGFHNNGGLQVAGPGYFVVKAGRDLGPFLPASHNTVTEAKVQMGIASVGNASLAPVGSRYVIRVSTGMYNPVLLGPSANVEKRRNPLLTGPGADIVAMFGVAKGVDYAAVISNYIDPANAANVPHNYVYNTAALRSYLGTTAVSDYLKSDAGRAALDSRGINLNQLDDQTAWRVYHEVLPQGLQRGFVDLAAFLGRVRSVPSNQAEAWATFQSLPAELKQVFAEQVFFAELKAVGLAEKEGLSQFQRGYQMVNTMFPASLGYTKNDLSGGPGGANELVRTGNLDLLHASIQTRLGGDISIFGPGGNILVGTLARESNPNFATSDLGILTLGGGSINTFTDGSVLVNSSRVLTVLGGDVVMWSSNGDLNAGRGAKTTSSLPPLAVLFDTDDYQTIDARGLVTGAGIGVLKSTSFASNSNAYLLAPRGIVDFGDAGVRVSGDLVVAANQVVNADNVRVGGTATGIPTIPATDVGGLTSASNTAAAAARTEGPTGSTGDRSAGASVFIVEVTGYGGGDGQGQTEEEDKKRKENAGAAQ
jgi:filamentous hemagglutinin family protein